MYDLITSCRPRVSIILRLNPLPFHWPHVGQLGGVHPANVSGRITSNGHRSVLSWLLQVIMKYACIEALGTEQEPGSTLLTPAFQSVPSGKLAGPRTPKQTTIAHKISSRKQMLVAM